jgi:type I restriction-modification system DNA methylase subunit
MVSAERFAMPAPDIIHKLVQRFNEQRDVYTNPSGGYNETRVRRDFIDPFFKALGWDIDNADDYAEAYRDVIHEDMVLVGTAKKAPDYSFRVGGTRKFFVEAKKPSVSIKQDPRPAFQIRRYGWSAKLPVSILTDFEELAIYDCTYKPLETDPPTTARLKIYNYQEYAENWDEIAALFSKTAILKGSFDRFADSKKRGTATVDEEFLAEIETWRQSLASNILKNNEVTPRQLNQAVQLIIDRIIFLRICEDRGVEPYEKLLGLRESKGEIYKRLVSVFKDADDRYNSGLFHFNLKDKHASEADTLTLTLKIEDAPLREIIESLYLPESSYEFSVFPAEILGQVYERFLGKVIHVEGKQVKIEEKPDVKKAGGVFYTPSYIVDYIVKNTVDKLLEGKTPKQVEKLKIVDPACGSGSFLIVAYQHLLDWHLNYYMANGGVEKFKKDVHQTQKGLWRLTTQTRKRILLNNIFGVDIDSQAVEVTKLSLLLKVLEGESSETIGKNLSFFHERALPDLGANIKCGNSLVGSDFYAQLGLSQLTDEDHYRINAFDWKDAFPNVFKQGGFNAVIGNPPYGAKLDKLSATYLKPIYKSVSDLETSQYFMVMAKSLMAKEAYLSFIVPNTLFLNTNAKKFRDYLLSNFSIEEFVDLSQVNVFEGATVRTAIPLLTNDKPRKNKVLFYSYLPPFKVAKESVITQKELGKLDSWQLNSDSSNTILGKIKARSIPLKDILNISQGLIPYDKYRGHDEATIKHRIWHADFKKDATYKPELRGGDVKRYQVTWNGKNWISYGKWLAAPRKPAFFNEERILVREITNGRIEAAFCREEYYNNPSIINCVAKPDTKINLKLPFILGLVNSKLLSYYHRHTSPKANKGVFPKILVNDVRSLPILNVDFKNPDQLKSYEAISALAEKLNELMGGSSKPLEAQVKALDRSLDNAVYQAFGLTEDEISVVEGS